MAANPEAKFRERLRSVQEDRALSAAELAGVAGVSVRSVERWRTGPELPGLGAVYLLAAALQVDPGWLVGGEGRQP